MQSSPPNHLNVPSARYTQRAHDSANGNSSRRGFSLDTASLRATTGRTLFMDNGRVSPTDTAKADAERDLDVRCQKFIDWTLDQFMMFCQEKKISKPGERRDACCRDALFFYNMIVRRPTKGERQTIRQESVRILEDLERTNVSISSSEFLSLRRSGRLDDLGGESELEKFIEFNKMPLQLESVGFAKKCLDRLTYKPTFKHNCGSTLMLSNDTRTGISDTIAKLPRTTVSCQLSAKTLQAVSTALSILTDRCEEATKQLLDYQQSRLLSKKRRKARGLEHRRTTRCKLHDLERVAGMLETIGSSFASATSFGQESDNFSSVQTSSSRFGSSMGVKAMASTIPSTTVLSPPLHPASK